LISVVVPVWNGAEWLDEAIGSILAQTHAELELIAVDDGSTDASRDIAAAARDARVRTIALDRDPGAKGTGRPANIGIAAARGAYIARMDADDIALPDRLERQLAFLEERRLDACGGLAQAFGALTRDFWFPETHEGVERELVFRVAILHPTMLARTALMRRLLYREDVAHEDYEWQVRAAAAGARLGNLQETVLRHRVHPGQANRRLTAEFRRDLRRHRFSHVMRLFPGTPPAEYQHLAALAEEAPIRDEGELKAAAGWLLRLAEGGDAALRAYMARRWHKACDRAGEAADSGLRLDVAGRLAA
jgi:glycosyltransferase involved in cell wall biosynthesis